MRWKSDGKQHRLRACGGHGGTTGLRPDQRPVRKRAHEHTARPRQKGRHAIAVHLEHRHGRRREGVRGQVRAESPNLPRKLGDRAAARPAGGQRQLPGCRPDRDQRRRTQRHAATAASLPVPGRTAREGPPRGPQGRLDRGPLQRVRHRVEHQQGPGRHRAAITQRPGRAAVEGPSRPGNRRRRLVRRDVQLLQVSGLVRRRGHELLPPAGCEFEDRQGPYGDG